MASVNKFIHSVTKINLLTTYRPTIAFIVFGIIAAGVCFLLIETMSNIEGNENFQGNVEYSTIAKLYTGNKAHIIMQILLYCALQSVNVSSMIMSEQTIDSLLIRLFKKTCALSFTEGFVCATKVNPDGSPFESYILGSFGYIIAACMVIPLSLLSLVENIKFQLASAGTLFFVMGTWIYIFASDKLDQDIPTFGSMYISFLTKVL